jgi:hypothetical protein
MESVTESASRTAMEIGGLTGMNKDAIQKFVDDNNLDIEKVFQFVKKGKLKDRMELVSAIAGKPNNTVQKKMIKMFSESVNEAYDFKPNKNMNNLMKGRKIKNVVYSDKLGFAIILDNGKFVLIRGHRATPGSEKELELESVNEGFSTEEKRIVLMAVKKISKYMNVDLPTAMNYLLGAGQELERDIKKGKIK